MSKKALAHKYRKGGPRYKLALRRNRQRRSKSAKGSGSIKAAQAKRDQQLKQQIIDAHETLTVHDDHEIKYPMDYPALKKKKCKKGKGKKAAKPAAAPKGKKPAKKPSKKPAKKAPAKKL